MPLLAILNVMLSVEAGVAFSLILPPEISASNVASAAAPVNIVAYSVMLGVVPSCVSSISVA